MKAIDRLILWLETDYKNLTSNIDIIKKARELKESEYEATVGYVDEAFEGLGDFIDDEDTLHFYKSLIVESIIGY